MLSLMNRLGTPLFLFLSLVFSSAAADAPGAAGWRGTYGGFDDPFRGRTGPEVGAARAVYAAVWRDFDTTTAALGKSIGARNVEAGSLLTQIRTNALFLREKWDVWFQSHSAPGSYASDDAYLTSLRANNRLLNQLKKQQDEPKALGVLRDVALDLQIKADNCRNSGDGLGKEIRVRVHTKAGTNEVAGFEVFYVSKGMLDVKSAYDRFPRQSSPTDERILCPGGYAIWARKKGFTSEPVTLRVGGHGETHLDVDLPVPPQ